MPSKPTTSHNPIPSMGPLLKAKIVSVMERQRLDRALTELLGDGTPGLSRARLQALIKDGHVTLAGRAVTDTSRRVKAGEIYEIGLPPPEPAVPEAQAIALDIVYEDKDLIVIDKPAGLVVHPAPGNRDRTLVNALLAHCKGGLSGIGGVARPGIVHRLDKDTSGLIVVAKTDAAHQALTRQFADRSLSRTYQAVVWGAPKFSGSVDAPIGRHPRDRKKMAVTAKGRAALTHYKVLKLFYADGMSQDITPSPAKTKGLLRKPRFSLPLPQGERNVLASLVECKLATGRTHQIRVHLAHIKHPVVGDPVYGRKRKNPSPLAGEVRWGGAKQASYFSSSKRPPRQADRPLPQPLPRGEGGLESFPRQALHAVGLQFVHPRSGKRVSFAAPLPPDMVGLLRVLGKNN